MEIEGDTALVTGGGRGIGAAICRKLAEHGLDIVIADIDEEGMQRTRSRVEDRGRSALPLYTDVREESSVRSTIERARSTFGSIEVLVNNAGIAGPTAPVEDVDPDDWDDAIAINLRGPFLLCRALVGPMKERRYGRIVTISSASGKRPVPRRAPYTSSKAGLLGLTRTLAYEGGPYNVNANAVCPGTVEGPRIDRVIDREADATGRDRDAVADDWRHRSPRNEFVQADDVAHLVAFLCSSDADRITGQSVNVSAGKITY